MVVVIDPFDAVIGAGVIGSAAFAVVAIRGGGPVPPGGLGVIGGSGFPADWLERLRGRPGAVLDDQEIEELVALGLL